MENNLYIFNKTGDLYTIPVNPHGLCKRLLQFCLISCMGISLACEMKIFHMNIFSPSLSPTKYYVEILYKISVAFFFYMA